MLCLQGAPLFVCFGKACFRLLAARFESTLSDVQEETDVETQGIREIISNKHWPRRKVCQQVLEHFDVQYTAELGSLWTSARSVLLNPDCWQYGVMLNRFTDVGDVRTRLQELGYASLFPHRDRHTPTLSHSHALPAGSLECMVQRSAVRLPSVRHEPGRLKSYYLLNAASLLPVLALGLAEGDHLLDMCSAPGGKAIAIMQTTSPGLLHCNEVDTGRCDWLSKTLESYVPASLMETLQITNQDGRDFGHTHAGVYDKVLVDAPCSNDRSWLFTSSAQQGELWLKERQKLPQIQIQLLRSALAAVRPGGVVVYSTCTLSRAENHAVVKAVLATCPGVEPEDLQEELANQLSDNFTFAPPLCPPGLLVVPQPFGRTWGPMYLCRLRKR